MRTYVFVDTNIFLDFYRGKNESNLSLLEKLSRVKDSVICTYQVEMEFLKNRQSVLLCSIEEVKHTLGGAIPAVLHDSRRKDSLSKIQEDAKKRIEALHAKLKKVLENPNAHDRVYKTLEEIFTSPNSHVLTRDMPIRHKIKQLARRRFLLGYPPRKQNDTSYGDALNWEWIIHVSKQLQGRIYIVSRDGDYGCQHDKTFHLNDALRREFRDRVGNKSIIYTRKLSEALKALEISVTAKEEKEEAKQLVTGAGGAEPLSLFENNLRNLYEQLLVEVRQRADATNFYRIVEQSVEDAGGDDP